MLGPFQFFDRRRDDPNDIVPHEHRRELRGIRVFAAWLGYNWISPLTTVDVLVRESGVRYIRHYLVDFFSALGSGFNEPKRAQEGFEPFFSFGRSLKNVLGFGVYMPRWQRAHYPKLKSLGRFEYEVFDPEKWTANYETAILANALPDDLFWAARIVMSFTDEDLATLVETGQYSNRETTTWLTRCLIERRNKIGKAYFERVLPLDEFHVEDGALRFEDLALQYGFTASRQFDVEWSIFRNDTQVHTLILGGSGPGVSERVVSAASGEYFSARITGNEPGKSVTVYFRKDIAGLSVVGVERGWSGKVIAQEQAPTSLRHNRLADLKPRPRELFDRYTADYNQLTGLQLTPEEYFQILPISKRTTFDAVTHALMRTEIRDTGGNSVGHALDLVDHVERIAGQYPGRQGDEQFRIYFGMRSDAMKIIQEAPDFKREKDNSVYHVGYRFNFRQTGKYPSIQFSMSEDGMRADIDVDYRSSKLPQALWNGHLTSANSDVRAGDNYKRQNNRWSGLIAWWKALFGDLPEEGESETDLLAGEVPEPPTPLPPNRPKGAAITNVGDAIQEFLSDWLVRRNTDEALEFVSDKALACVNVDEDAEDEILSPEGTRARLRELMEAAAGRRLGDFKSLTDVIDAVVPWRKIFRVVPHPYDGDFALVEVPDAFARAFMCQTGSQEDREKALADSQAQYRDLLWSDVSAEG